MGQPAGTAAAVIGTIAMGGGAMLASYVDRAIADRSRRRTWPTRATER